MGSGRNIPSLFDCELEDGTSVELVVKCSAKLFEGPKGLAYEAIAAMLAADLGLPVPEPFIVEFESEFADLIGDNEVKTIIKSSCKYAFGSRLVTGHAAWQNGQIIPEGLTQSAAEVAVFDHIIINSDRRPVNPNCQVLGEQLVLFDHELTFTKYLFWTEPWSANGVDQLRDAEKHIFAGPYFSSPPMDFDRFVDAWDAITEQRIDEYGTAIPDEWVPDQSQLQETLSYLKDVKRNIRTITENALKVLR
ncbi:hypothetical protein DXT88_06055 [Herbaspirillum lusitanum]|nr:hypothetical protein [Herbaspirillum lusitanum]